MITSTTTDADLFGHLRRHPGALAATQAEAGSLMRQAETLPYAPRALIHEQWLAFQRRMTAAAAPPGTNLNSPVDQAARATMLRIALEAAEHFGAYLKMTVPQMIALEAKQKQATLLAMQQATLAAGSPAAPPVFDAARCFAQLAMRGVALSVGHDGSLLAAPAGLLTPADKATLVAHEAALRAFLRTSERVA